MIIDTPEPQPDPTARFTVQTKLKRTILSCEQPPEDNQQVLLMRDAPWARMFPELQPRSRSATYNCMGMVFAGRRAHIDARALRVLLQDDGYAEIDKTRARVGDLVVYSPDKAPSLTHVGIIYSVPVAGDRIIEMMILSKWGESGEYLHPLHKVPPAYGQPRSFWSERKNI